MGLRVLGRISNLIRKRAKVKIARKIIQMQGDVNVGRIVMIKSFCRVILCFLVAVVFVAIVHVAFLFGKVVGTIAPMVILIACLTYLENKYHG